MKTSFYLLISAGLFCVSQAWSQAENYTNFIRQVQYPTGVVWDASVEAAGQQESVLEINPGGARFDLWTVDSTGPTSYLLDSTYVGSFVGTVKVRSEDDTAAKPRTRADRPFYVDITVEGLSSDATDPESSRTVNFMRHVQSYGEGGTDLGLDRSQAILLAQSSITTNGTQNLTFPINEVPGADRMKVRGEERFSLFSLANTETEIPASQLSSQYIQIWPVADGLISGIANGDKLRFQLPQVTVTLNDLYPFSTTYAQVYQGMPQLGVSGKTVQTGFIVNQSEPEDKTLVFSPDDLAEVLTSDGIWTMELVTVTPFGPGPEIMRDIDGNPCTVWFEVDRTMKMNGSFTTVE